MKLTLDRKYKLPTYTIGKLYVNGFYFCDVLEDTDRGINQSMKLQDIMNKKVYGKTAIPSGTYYITMNVVSPKYSKVKFYYDNCRKGRVPRLLNVPGWDGVLIHAGNVPEHTLGCLLVGENKVKGQVVNSRETFRRLYEQMERAYNRNEDITIEII